MTQEELMTVRFALMPTVLREEIGEFFIRRAWVLHSFEEGGGREPYEEVWGDRDGEAAAFYVEDDLVGVNYLTLEAPQGERIEGLAGEVKGGLRILTTADALEWVRRASTLEEKIVAAAHLGLVTEAPDPAVISKFGEVLLDTTSDPLVRQAALISSTYAAWPELDEILGMVASSDSDLEVRAAARRVLKSLRRHR
jgi:hypothetical protein